MKLCACGCGEPAPIADRTDRARGYVKGEPRTYVNGHWGRGRKHTHHPPPEERFWAKVDRRGEDECWPWLAFINPDGYGRFTLDGEGVFAHRFAYELLVGPIPENLTIDHWCENRACVNPAHLEAVPSRVNTLRGKGFAAVNALKTHCIHGHEYTPENTYHERKGRSCRQCRREASRRARANAA